MPRIVSDIVEIYPYRIVTGGPEFLLLRRSSGALLAGTWQAAYGHIEPGETAIGAARRELSEETGLTPQSWHQLESVNTFFLASRDEIHLCPGFAALVAGTPLLNNEHDRFEWLRLNDAEIRFCWPGQRAAVREIATLIIPQGPAANALCVHPSNPGSQPWEQPLKKDGLDSRDVRS